MAAPTVTITEVENEVKFLIAGTTTVDSTLGDRIRFNVATNTRLLGTSHDFYFMVKDATISLADGTADYELADDFYRMDGITMWYTDTTTELIQHLTDYEYERYVGRRVFQTEARPEFFTLIGSATDGQAKARFFPTPDTSYTANYSYYAVPADIRTSGNPDARIPMEFHRAIVLMTVLGFPGYISALEYQAYSIELRKVQAALNSRVTGVLAEEISASRFLVPFRGRGNAFILPPETLSGS